MSILRQSAKHAPQCFSCGLENPNSDRLCLAHSSELQHGRGIGHKSKDIYGAIVCHNCHQQIDGVAGGLSKLTKRTMQRIAHDRTVSWWIENGYLVPRE